MKRYFGSNDQYCVEHDPATDELTITGTNTTRVKTTSSNWSDRPVVVTLSEMDQL